MTQRTVTVFGSSAAKPGEPAYETAYELGQAIARAGWTLCNGGYGGTMEASAKGAVEAGGHTIGVTCSALGWRGGPNAFVRQEVSTPDLLARLGTLVRLGDAYVVLPGGTGTLLELALVWELVNKGLAKRGVAIVLLGDHWAGLQGAVQREQPSAALLPLVQDVPSVIAVLRGRWGPNAVPEGVAGSDEG